MPSESSIPPKAAAESTAKPPSKLDIAPPAKTKPEEKAPKAAKPAAKPKPVAPPKVLPKAKDQSGDELKEVQATLKELRTSFDETVKGPGSVDREA